MIMGQYISKAAVVAEIERHVKLNETCQKISGGNEFYRGAIDEAKEILSFLNTLEVKEIHEDIDMDLNPFFEELGVEPDSRIAYTFKEAFYKGIDRYLNKKENQVKQINQ